MPSRSPPVSPTLSPITSKKIKGEENYLLNPVDEANLRLELKETEGNLKKTTDDLIKCLDKKDGFKNLGNVSNMVRKLGLGAKKKSKKKSKSKRKTSSTKKRKGFSGKGQGAALRGF